MLKRNLVGLAYHTYKVTERIGRILEKRKIKAVFKPIRTIQQSVRSAKDKRDPLSASGVYRILCSCGCGQEINMGKRV